MQLDALRDVSALDEHMKTNSYVSGYAPSQQDAALFAAVAEPPPSHPHARRWYDHLAGYTAAQRAALPGDAPKLAPASAAPAAPKKPAVSAKKRSAPSSGSGDGAKAKSPRKQKTPLNFEGKTAAQIKRMKSAQKAWDEAGFETSAEEEEEEEEDDEEEKDEEEEKE